MQAGRISLAVGLIVTMCAGIASADYRLTYTRATGTGVLTGKTIFRFYARNDQTNGQTGTKSLLAYEMYLESMGAPMTFAFGDLDADSTLDADLWADGFPYSAPEGTFFKLGSFQEIRMIDMDGNKKRWLSTQNPIAPATYFADKKQVIGTTINLSKPDATIGSGLLVAVGVVPQGTEMYFHGQMAAESGPIYGGGTGMTDEEYINQLLATKANEGGGDAQGGWFDVAIWTPEPGSLLALTGGVLLLGLRRRRVA